jgi:integrase
MSTQSTRVPKCRHHRASGQARVTINGKDHYLGVWGSPESKQRYRKVLAEHLGKQPRTIADELDDEGTDLAEVTIETVLAAYWQHASTVYVDRRTGKPTPELSNLKHALAIVRKLFGSRGTQTPDLVATKFGPLKLKQCRQVLVDEGHTRTHVNDQVARIRRMIRWATENEIVPPAVFHGLQAVRGLKAGEGMVREGRKVPPVPMLHVEAVLPHVSRPVATAIRLQLLTGARPGEILAMRPCDVTRDGPHGCWTYKPQHHKTEHHGHERIIFLGPRAQALLEPFLTRDAGAWCFSPIEAERERNDAKMAARKCQPSRRYDPRKRRKPKPQVQPDEVYTVDSYRRAIERACGRAKVQRWTPHQLRHTAGTELRREFGVETAQVTLGHKNVNVTEVYAEKNLDAVARAIAKVG